MNILYALFPSAYKHFLQRSQDDFKGMLVTLLDIDEARNIYRVHIGVKAGSLFEKYAYIDLLDFSDPDNIDVMIEMIKKKMEQRNG